MLFYSFNSFNSFCGNICADDVLVVNIDLMIAHILLELFMHCILFLQLFYNILHFIFIIPYLFLQVTYAFILSLCCASHHVILIGKNTLFSIWYRSAAMALAVSEKWKKVLCSSYHSFRICTGDMCANANLLTQSTYFGFNLAIFLSRRFL